MVKSTIESVFLTLSSKKHVVIAIILAMAMAFLSIIIPSLLTPGNTIKLQLSLLEISDISVIIIFSVLFGIAIAMQSYALHKEKIYNNKLGLKGTGTGFIALTGTLFSAKLCPICLGAILGSLGIGGSATLFLFSYKNEIMAVSIVVLISIIYVTGKRITKNCKKCR